MSTTAQILNFFVARLGFRIIREDDYQTLARSSERLDGIGLLALLLAEIGDPQVVRSLTTAYSKGRSDQRQDLFVLSQIGLERPGYFVEFGACDGIQGSNTYLLEKEFGWTGILAEPAKVWHASLAQNRAAAIDRRCVWRESGQNLEFVEAAFLSTLVPFISSDKHASNRIGGLRYMVPTISLTDLLRSHDAPQTIDYLSLDTEGSEYDILAAFDFDEFDIRVITCEHNRTDARGRIFDLLTSRGFVRLFEEYSGTDDWFVKRMPAR